MPSLYPTSTKTFIGNNLYLARIFLVRILMSVVRIYINRSEFILNGQNTSVRILAVRKNIKWSEKILNGQKKY